MLLRVPLFYKIVVANSVIVILGALGGTAVTRAYLRSGASGSTLVLAVALALIGVGLTVLVNALVVRLALRPLQLLEQTAARVHAGDLDARVPVSVLTDREMERLTGTFNAMLDTLAAYRQRMREVAARALNAAEEERKRIARELHDDTAQTMAALLIRIRLLRGLDDPAERERALDQFRIQLSGALERVRRFAHGLRPPALDELGLVPALESHVRTLAESVGIAIRVDAEPLDGLLSPQAELALYRIAQEALSNAVRHADATRVEVSIERGADAASLTVTDDGRGFVVPEVAHADGNGLGLFGMQERAVYVGGRVDIRSEPGRGTRVRAAIPAAGGVMGGLGD